MTSLPWQPFVLNNILIFHNFNKGKSTMKADVFIIPSSIGKVHETILTNWNRRLERWGFRPMTEEEPKIQIWVTSPEEDSWCNHGAPDNVCLEFGVERTSPKNYFPTVFPVKLFKELKEGQELTLRGNASLTLRAAQEKYRYKQHGKFEEVYVSMISW